MKLLSSDAEAVLRGRLEASVQSAQTGNCRVAIRSNGVTHIVSPECDIDTHVLNHAPLRFVPGARGVTVNCGSCKPARTSTETEMSARQQLIQKAVRELSDAGSELRKIDRDLKRLQCAKVAATGRHARAQQAFKAIPNR